MDKEKIRKHLLSVVMQAVEDTMDSIDEDNEISEKLMAEDNESKYYTEREITDSLMGLISYYIE